MHGGRGHRAGLLDLFGIPVQQRPRRKYKPTRCNNGVGVYRTAYLQYADPYRISPGSKSHCEGDVRIIGKYGVIYADPPWRYQTWKGQGVAERHYPTMHLEDIKALPVAGLAGKDCVLFLWATYPMLQEALDVIRAWGFTFKTVGFTWIKLAPKADSIYWGMGYWTRSNAEICLLATKGQPRRQAKNVHQVIISHVEEHSKKPDEARRRIVALMGDVPRVELFARRPVPGWDVWGNEVNSTFDWSILR